MKVPPDRAKILAGKGSPWMWVGLAVVMAAVFIGVFSRRLSSPTSPGSVQESQEQKVADIIKSGDLVRCAEAKGITIDGVDYEQVCRNNIAMDLALAKIDMSYCANLDGKLMNVDDCKQQVLLKKLDEKKDIAVCDEAPTPQTKSSCKTQYWLNEAAAGKHAALCDSAADASGRASCEDIFLAAQFFSDQNNVDCGSFSADATRNDCQTFKDMSGKVGGNARVVCSQLRSLPFVVLCQRMQP